MSSALVDTAPALRAADRALLRRVKAAVRAVEPEAEVILYGSRARGEAHADSDWDLLVLVDGPVAPERRRRIAHPIYDVEWQAGAVLTVIVHDRREWHEGPHQITPFYANVSREGVRL